MNELPEKIVDIEILKIRRNMRKICSCENPQYDVDVNNRAVWCRVCGAWIDPFEAILDIAKNREKLIEGTNYLYEKHKDAYEKIKELNREIEMLANKKARLNVFKHLEQEYRSDMLPHCPNCDDVFHFEEITGWTNRKYTRERRSRNDETAHLQQS